MRFGGTLIDLTSDDDIDGPNAIAPPPKTHTEKRVPRPAFQSPRHSQLNNDRQKRILLGSGIIAKHNANNTGSDSDSPVELVSSAWKPTQKQRLSKSSKSATQTAALPVQDVPARINATQGSPSSLTPNGTGPKVTSIKLVQTRPTFSQSSGPQRLVQSARRSVQSTSSPEPTRLDSNNKLKRPRSALEADKPTSLRDLLAKASRERSAEGHPEPAQKRPRQVSRLSEAPGKLSNYLPLSTRVLSSSPYDQDATAWAKESRTQPTLSQQQRTNQPAQPTRSAPPLAPRQPSTTPKAPPPPPAPAFPSTNKARSTQTTTAVKQVSPLQSYQASQKAYLPPTTQITPASLPPQTEYSTANVPKAFHDRLEQLKQLKQHTQAPRQAQPFQKIQPVQTVQSVRTIQPVQTTQSVRAIQPVETTQPMRTTQPVRTVQPAQSSQVVPMTYAAHPIPLVQPAPAPQHIQIPQQAGQIAAMVESRHGQPFSKEEDDLLVKLRRDGVRWEDMINHFQGRTRGSLQVRFSTKLQNRRPTQVYEAQADVSSDDASGVRAKRDRLLRKSTFRSMMPAEEQATREVVNVSEAEQTSAEAPTAVSIRTRPLVSSTTRLLRHRELGGSMPSSRSQTHNLLQLREAALDKLTPRMYFENTCGDVSAVAWSRTGHIFAAGSVATSDESSMQYNKPLNLLLGDTTGLLRELPEHHLPRPIVEKGVNSTPSMHASQDSRLFTTVQMVGFSPNGSQLYSTSIDGRLNVYDVTRGDVRDARYMYSVSHGAPVDLLSISSHGLVATGFRSQERDTIKVFHCGTEESVEQQALRAQKAQEGQSVFPSALRWGVTPRQSNFLLAGFTQDREVLYEDDDPIDTLGETCMFDGITGQSLRIQTTPRNVFDVAWNPNDGHTAFAVASVVFGRVNPGMHSVVRLFSERQSGDGYGLKSVLELECPARDINDVVYCPYDDNLVAAGSTDGKVYVWDTRYVKASQTPRNRLVHDSCLSVLQHDRRRWEIDTGVRFLSWGESHTRLYTGSSDGVVKVWNPYLADDINHVKDVASFQSAIMSGAFSPDYTNLLVGEDTGRINLLTVGNMEAKSAQMPQFKLIHAPEPSEPSVEAFHDHLLNTDQVMIAPCGALPIRQVVQGPAYQPLTRFAPTNNKPTAQIRDVLEADYAALRMAAKNDDVRSSAHSFQTVLCDQRRAHERLMSSLPSDTKPCNLECDFRPYRPNDDGEAPDSQRSLSRIPNELRAEPPAGLKAQLRGLNAKCAVCGQPAHPNDRDDSDGKDIRCEKCGFGCLRCGSQAEVNIKDSWISCWGCRTVWRADALGYEVLLVSRGDKTAEAKHGQRTGQFLDEANGSDYGDEHELGHAELERFMDMAI